MSVVDEDTELRDLLVQTLDKNGVLGKIKAELRASIFLALEAQDQVKNPSSLANSKLQTFLSKPEGQTCVELIHEFLDFFSLDYSSAVFSPETSTTSSYKSPASLHQRLNLNQDENSTNSPVLASLLKQQASSISAMATRNQLENARRLFSANLDRGSEFLSSTAATYVLSSLCPKFPLFLIERYVAEEVKSLGSDISMPSFLSMYEKLFYACHSVVTENTENGDVHNGEIKKPSAEKSAESYLKQSIGLSEKRVDPVRNTSISSPDETPASPYEGHFFDDDYYSKPKDSPVKLTDSKPTSLSKIPRLNDSSKPTILISETSEKADWSAKDKNTTSDKRQLSYEDDFNTTSHASISEDLQGDSLLLSSTHSSMAELTEDHTVSEADIRADYLEEIKK